MSDAEPLNFVRGINTACQLSGHAGCMAGLDPDNSYGMGLTNCTVGRRAFRTNVSDACFDLLQEGCMAFERQLFSTKEHAYARQSDKSVCYGIQATYNGDRQRLTPLRGNNMT